MNYEELVNGLENNGGKSVGMPVGVLRKQRVDMKFVNVVTLHEWLAKDAIFLSQLRNGISDIAENKNEYQIPFALNDENTELRLDCGNIISIAQLLNENPAICADKAFINGLFSQIVEWGSDSSQRGVYHVCFSPQNVFVHRKTHKLALVTHGSFFLHGIDQKELYKDFEEYVAPEVLSDCTVDERCDVYSVGKLFEYIFSYTDVPRDYKTVLAKATEILPEDRYDSLANMQRALKRRHGMFRSIKELCVATVVALVVVGLFFSITSTNTSVEYVTPAPKEIDEDNILSEDGVDLAAAMADIMSDTINELTPEKKKQLEEYRAKVANIFRRRYEREADRILTVIYNRSYRNTSDKSFVNANQDAIEELMKVQNDIAAQTGVDPGTSRRIAQEVIDKISEQKQREWSKK